MIAWALAERVAQVVAGEHDAAAGLPGDLDALAGRAEAAVCAYAGLVPRTSLPPPEAVGRAEWTRTNLLLLRATIEPLSGAVDRQLQSLPGPLRAVTGGAVGAEVGAVVGWMGRRVLGQYEIALTADEPPPPRLLLVAPNVRDFASRLDVPLGQLVAWIMVHEVTHAVQFASVPWLRAHLGGLVARLLASADVALGSPADGGDLRALAARLREGGLLTAMAGAERRELLDRIQSAMALVEGHAEHVMDAAAGPLVPELGRLRAALERRRAERSPLAALLERLLGLDLKLRQYREGKRFCDEVVAAAGVAALNRAWVAPELLPSAAELRDPPSWLRRTRPRLLPAA